jgi:2-desacetyl-2-hydroxyethyl bacteriochlorophyllide A dehydrogenase
VLPFVLRWGNARVKALVRRRGLVRGTVLVCPSPGRLWATGHDVPLPGPRELLVRAEASVISPGTERAFFVRLPNAVPTYPYVPGYSLAGEVVVTGRGSRYRTGDRVALAAPHASLALVSESQVFLIPPEVSFEEAAFTQLGIIALQAVGKARIAPGHPVVVLGVGLIGQLLLHLCAAFGAHPLVAVSRTARRISGSLGEIAHRVVILEREGVEPASALGSLVTFDATGSPDGVSVALQCTAPGGKVILAGSTRGVTRQADFGLLADRRITIIGAHINSLSPEARAAHAEVFLALLRDRRLDVSTLVSDRVHPLEAEWFYRRLAGRGDATVGAVLCWSRLSPEERMRRVHYLAPPDLDPLRRSRLILAPLSSRRQPWGEAV